MSSIIKAKSDITEAGECIEASIEWLRAAEARIETLAADGNWAEMVAFGAEIGTVCEQLSKLQERLSEIFAKHPVIEQALKNEEAAQAELRDRADANSY